MPTSNWKTLRVHSHGGERVAAIVTLLSDLEYAYNGRVIFQSAIERIEEGPDGLWVWPYRGWHRGGLSGFVLGREDLASMVHPRRRLRLSAARLESPGFFDFLGRSLSVEAISQALNDRQARKELEASEPHRRKMEAHAEKAAELDNLDKAITIAERLGVGEHEIAPLVNQLIERPMRELERHLDSGLIEEVEIVDEDYESN